jgi:hypothetical protein
MNMIKAFLKLLLCIGIVVSASAKTKIALVGDSEKTNQIADMALANMANNNDLEFVERSAIEQVLKEHKLHDSGVTSKQIPMIAKLLHTDIYAVLSSAQVEKKTVPSSLRVFDARNGFCLVDAALPPGAEECVGFVNAKLNNAVKTLADHKKLKFVSILAVRNAGAPEKYKRQMTKIAIELERYLIAMPDIAVLERSELGLINKERKITKESFKLVPSAYLLDLEFSPGAAADKINLKIYILNTAGKELADFNFPDCLKNEPSEIMKALAKYLKAGSPDQITTDSKREAKRFWDEYKFFRQADQYSTAKHKLEAAVALCPDNPDYLYELAEFSGYFSLKYYRSCPANKSERFMFLLKQVKDAIQIYDEHKANFSNYKKCLYRISGIGRMRYIIFSGASFNKEQIEETRKVMRELRAKAFPEWRKFGWKADLSIGFSSTGEFKKGFRWLYSGCDLEWFLNYPDYYDYSYRRTVEVLKATRIFLRKHPELINKQGRDLRPWLFFFVWGTAKENFQEWERYIKNSQNLIEEAKKHPDKEVQNYGRHLEFYQKMAMDNYDPEKFKINLRKYLIDNKKLPYRLKLFIGFFLRLSNKQKRILVRLAEEEHSNYIRNSEDENSLKFLSMRLDSEKKPDKLAELIIDNRSKVIEFRNLAFKGWKSYYQPEDLRRQLWAWELKLMIGNSPVCRKALAVLNYPFTVEELKRINSVQIIGKVMDGKKIYILALTNRSKEIMLYSYDPHNSKLEEIVSLDDHCNNDDWEKDECPFYVNEKYFLIGAPGEIIVIPRDNLSPRRIKDLPAKRIAALTILDKRIYAFVGDKKAISYVSSGTILFSCSFYGEDRKIDISTQRRKKLNYFDKQKPFRVAQLFADEKSHRLLFINKQGLWEFYPENGDSKKLVTCSGIWGMRVDGELYIAGSYPYSYYTFELDSDKADFRFYTGTKGEVKYLKGTPAVIKHIPGTPPPFLIKNNAIWYCSDRAGYIDLSFKDHLVRMFFGLNRRAPERYKYFPHPDGHSILVVSRTSIFKITPPSRNDNKIALRQK